MQGQSVADTVQRTGACHDGVGRHHLLLLMAAATQTVAVVQLLTLLTTQLDMLPAKHAKMSGTPRHLERADIPLFNQDGKQAVYWANGTARAAVCPHGR